jgi:pilus assembly protein CpaF
MLLRYYSQFDGQPLLANVTNKRLLIGSGRANDVVLTSPFIDEESLELQRVDTGWTVGVLGRNGCSMNGQHLHRGTSVHWDGRSRLELFPYVFQFHTEQAVAPPTHTRLTAEIHELIRNIHVDLLQQMHLSRSAIEVPKDVEALLTLERSIEASAKHHGLNEANNGLLVAELAGNCVHDELLNLLLNGGQEGEKLSANNSSWSRFVSVVPDHESELKRWTMLCARKLFGKLDNGRVEHKVNQVESSFWALWDQLSPNLIRKVGLYLAMRQLKKQLKDILFGFGPLEDLLRIPTVTEIMVNSSQEIYIERSNVLQNSGRKFVSDEVTTAVIERIVGIVGRRIDTAQPMVDARLPDGSRVNAVIPPLAVKGPCLTIRKFSKKNFTMQKLIEGGSVTPQVVAFLESCVRSKRSILISGGTGTGKTTLLNCLSRAIATHERIICIEDTHELQLDHPHVVFVECRDGNNEGKGKVTIRDLVRNSLRQRPDRIVVGECRGDEALDMLQAMNTGHSGSMTTIHANSPLDALRRLEVLVRESGLPADAIRQQIVSAIDIVVQIARSPSGHRYVSGVEEVLRFCEISQTIKTRPIFQSIFDDATESLVLAPTGCLPSFAGELVRDGLINIDLFLRGIEIDAAEGLL